jgi:hypothetical protein
MPADVIEYANWRSSHNTVAKERLKWLDLTKAHAGQAVIR